MRNWPAGVILCEQSDQLHGWALLLLCNSQELDSPSVSLSRETQRNDGLSDHGLLCSHSRGHRGVRAVLDKPLNESSNWRGAVSRSPSVK